MYKICRAQSFLSEFCTLQIHIKTCPFISCVKNVLTNPESSVRINCADGDAGVAQLVEQLICNQQVGGSNPSTSSNFIHGGFPEWPKGTDCKSAGNAFGGSNPPSPTKYSRRSSDRRGYFFGGDRWSRSLCPAGVNPPSPSKIPIAHLRGRYFYFPPQYRCARHGAAVLLYFENQFSC